jgi:hypothetical protein
MFPNLRELYVSAKMERIGDQNYRSTKFDFIYPTTKLVRIEDSDHCELIRQLAMSNLVRHVNYLSLDLSCLSATTTTNIFSQLKNMPILGTIHLYDIKVKLMDLEILHSNLGSLKSLHLDPSYLCTGEIPLNVTPAILVTSLIYVIEEVDDLHTHVEFYKYIHKKYPSVSSPEGCDIPLPKEDDDYVREVYNKGIIPLYQDIGSQVDSFCFDSYCSGLDAFRKFDGYGFKLKDLEILSPYCDLGDGDDGLFLEELVQSNQAKYIQCLNLEELIPLPLAKLKHMEALHTLKIDCSFWRNDSSSYSQKTIDFSQFIKACPATLSKLAIRDIGFTFSDSQLHQTCLNYLELTSVDLTRDLVKIIETIFPKLSVLTLKGYLKSNLEISLPNHNLEKVSISTEATKKLWHGFVIKTTNDDKLQYHAPNKPPSTFLYASQVVPVTKEKFDPPFVLNFTCASVKELILSANSYY